MSRTILHQGKDSHHVASVIQTITTNTPPTQVWEEISNIVGLTNWLVDAKKTEFITKSKRGIGAGRKITFNDNNEVIEYVVGWKPERYLTYIATSGLPLDAYHATLSIAPKGKGSQISWTTFLVSQGNDKKTFEEFLSFLDDFYSRSLQNLKARLEKTT